MERAGVELSAAALQTNSQLCQHLGEYTTIWKDEVSVTSVILELHMLQWATLKLLSETTCCNQKFCTTDYH